MNRKQKMVLLASFVAGLAGCSPEIVPSSGPRMATQPADIKIYQKEPSKYERLGIVRLVITSKTHWEEKADATPAFEQLKAQAAALGANGLLLMDVADKSTVLVGARYAGGYYLVPFRQPTNTVVAEAIYVLKE